MATIGRADITQLYLVPKLKTGGEYSKGACVGHSFWSPYFWLRLIAFSFVERLCVVIYPLYCPAMQVFTEHLSEPEELYVLH